MTPCRTALGGTGFGQLSLSQGRYPVGHKELADQGLESQPLTATGLGSKGKRGLGGFPAVAPGPLLEA